MRILTPLVLAAAASALLLSACATDMGGGRHYSNAYDGYYDGAYGPYTSGYWDGDFFFYQGSGGFVRDDSHHFHREHFRGGHGFHAVPHP